MESTPTTTTKPTKRTSRPIFRVLVTVIILALAGLCTWQFLENRKLQDPSYATEEAKVEARKLQDQVGKLMQLPDGEAMIATVEDVTRLSEHDFFAGAQNGDKVLIFAEAGKAIMYRPSENRIINVSPIAINSATPPAGTSIDE